MKLSLLALSTLFIACSVQAIMPPQVYKKRIKNSPIKAAAVVLSVKIDETTATKVYKTVKFKLIKSYGKKLPDKEFTGSCISAGSKSMVGGTIFLYPAVGEKVFVTLGFIGDSSSHGVITSYTKLTPELERVLEQKGLDGLKYGFASVGIK